MQTGVSKRIPTTCRSAQSGISKQMNIYLAMQGVLIYGLEQIDVFVGNMHTRPAPKPPRTPPSPLHGPLTILRGRWMCVCLGVRASGIGRTIKEQTAPSQETTARTLAHRPTATPARLRYAVCASIHHGARPTTRSPEIPRPLQVRVPPARPERTAGLGSHLRMHELRRRQGAGMGR